MLINISCEKMKRLNGWWCLTRASVSHHCHPRTGLMNNFFCFFFHHRSLKNLVPLQISYPNWAQCTQEEMKKQCIRLSGWRKRYTSRNSKSCKYNEEHVYVRISFGIIPVSRHLFHCFVQNFSQELTKNGFVLGQKKQMLEKQPTNDHHEHWVRNKQHGPWSPEENGTKNWTLLSAVKRTRAMVEESSR